MNLFPEMINATGTSLSSIITLGSGSSQIYYYSDVVNYKSSDIVKNSVVRKIKKKKGDKTGKNAKSERLEITIEPLVIFSFIKNRFNFIQQRKLSKNLEKISEVLEVANRCQQIALSEKIREKFGVLLREQELIACGIKYYITEFLIQRFVSMCNKKVIKVTPIRNYIRIIPKSVRVKLEKCQKAKLFDDYVILHTDPNDTSVEKTIAEKKDPILFGRIANSKKLYFIDDWQDEFCDITFDKVLSVLSEKKDNLTIESFNLENDILDMLDS